ncbi:MAG: glycerol-3-phosphate 1-O-acyltransferase PlsY [Anaeroplasmataceae bacterium]
MFLMSNVSSYLLVVLLLVIAYLLGSIPNGLIIGKTIKKIDIREHGSKNIGTTNSIRVLGKKLGLTVFVLDVLKGMIVLLIVQYILAPLGIWESPISNMFYGVAAIFGHSFSIFLKFKGGKAVATSLGVCLALTPLPAILCVIVFLILLYTTGYVVICSTFASLTVLTTVWVLFFYGSTTNYFILKPTLLTCIVYTIMVIFIIILHRKNYIRLFKGTENSFKNKKIES